MIDYASLSALVRERAPLREYVEALGATVTASGEGWRCASPLRPDRTARAFVLRADGLRWRDYASGAEDWGDVTDLHQALHGFESRGAAMIDLAIRSGIALGPEVEAQAMAEARTRRERAAVRVTLTRVAQIYAGHLALEMRVWLRETYGLTDETIEAAQIGVSDGSLLRKAVPLGMSAEQLAEAGLLVRTERGWVELLRDRVVFPYMNNGSCEYMIARSHPQITPDVAWQAPKYKKLLVHSEKHPYVSPAIKNTLLGLGTLRTRQRGRPVLVCEGVTDTLVAHQLGYAAVSPVTTRMRAEDAQRLAEHLTAARVPEVVLLPDNDANGAGLRGALDTAHELHRLRIAVRIGALPRAGGETSADVASVYVAQGAGAIEAAISTARPLIELEIAGVNESSPAEAKAQCAARVAQLVAQSTQPQLEREATARAIKSAWKVGIGDARRLLAPPRPAGGAGPPTLRGAIFERGGVYCVAAPDGEPEAISTFVLRCGLRIRGADGDAFDCTATTQLGAIVPRVRLASRDFVSAGALKAAMRDGDLAWTGGDASAQALKALLSEGAERTVEGVDALGMAQLADGSVSVALPEENLGAQDVALTRPQTSLALRIGALPPARADDRELARVALPALAGLNEPAPAHAIVSWFFAATMAPRIRRRANSFPILSIAATAGAGKTTMIGSCYWPLFSGVRSVDAYSTTDTAFARVELLSSSTSLPVFIDEYREGALPRQQREDNLRFLRRVYGGEVERRGNADRTVAEYVLTAPVVLAGESRPSDLAVAERSICVSLRKAAIEGGPQYRAALDVLSGLDLRRLTRSVHEHALRYDVEAAWAQSADVVASAIGARRVALRVQRGLRVLVVGALCAEAYAREYAGLQLQLRTEAMLAHVLGEVVGEDGHVKPALDVYVEACASMALTGELEVGTHFAQGVSRAGELQIAINLPAAHGPYMRRARDVGGLPELDMATLRRHIREESEREGSYVVSTTERVSMRRDGPRVRCVILDVRLMEERGLDVPESWWARQRDGGSGGE